MAWHCLGVLANVNCFLMAFSRQRDFFGPARHWGFACGMFYLFPCILSVKNIGFSSLSAKGFNGILLDFYTRRWASFLVNFLYQTLLFRFLGFRLFAGILLQEVTNGTFSQKRCSNKLGSNHRLASTQPTLRKKKSKVMVSANVRSKAFKRRRRLVVEVMWRLKARWRLTQYS